MKRSLYKIGEARPREVEQDLSDPQSAPGQAAEPEERGKKQPPEGRLPYQAQLSPVYPYYPEDEIDLFESWQMLVRYKMLILLLALASTLMALAYALVATPVYRAEVLLAPVSHEEDDGKLSAFGSSQFGELLARTGFSVGEGGKQIALHIATLGSRALTTAFIEDENLMPVLFPEDAGEGGESLLSFFEHEAPTLWDAYNLFDEKIRSIELDRSTGLLTLAIEWQEPGLAAQWANSLVERVNDLLSTQAIEEARTSINYLEKQLEETSSVEVQQAIYRLIEAETKEIMLASVQDEYAFKVIDPAVAPREPIRPQRSLIVMLGLLAGLIVALFIAFFHNAIVNNRKRREETA